MDDEIKINEAEERHDTPTQAIETAETAVADIETHADDTAAAPCQTIADDSVGTGDDGNKPQPQDVAGGGAGSDERGDGPSVEALVAEAERRGYLRGRNERIEALMAEPGVWEERNTGPSILNRPRRSIWD